MLKGILKEKGLKGCLRVAGVVGGATLVGLFAHDRLGNNVELDGDSFIVSNYDLFRGYKFVYEVEPDGGEYLMYHKGNYVVMVETDCNDTSVAIRLEGSGKFSPLAEMSMCPERFYERGDAMTNRKLGELLLRRIRKRYEKNIPFDSIKEKLEG